MDLVAFHAPSDDADMAAMAAAINTACANTIVPPCLLAAIIKRETGGRNIFQIGMPRGPQCGVGPCQITWGVDWSSLDHPTFGGLDLTIVANNLQVAVRDFIVPLINKAMLVQQSQPLAFTASCRGQIAYAVACGYNAGWRNVQAAMDENVDADSKTTNRYARGDENNVGVYPTYIDYVHAAHSA